MKRIVSGIQATGKLHLGNYLGSIKQWKELQSQYETFIFVADLHSITIFQNPEDLRNASKLTIATYLACGIDDKSAYIFAQSQIPFHAELTWLFNCLTPVGWLNRMIQFKEKAGKDKENASTGLYTYPILMAADVLLYQADLVPVGEDQKQHIELMRNIAEAFNRKFQIEFFKLPEPYIVKTQSRIMSLRDGTKKMSKSDESDFTRINLVDGEDQIVKKVQKAKTDSLEYISYDKENRPEISNLLSIYSALADKKIEEIVYYFEGKSATQFKKELIDLLINEIVPIGNQIKRILQEESYIKQVLQKSREKVMPIAEKTVKKAKELFGFIT
jgi:tryptophanyl-tRNA synthetase